MEFPRPSLVRLARRAGVKSISEDSILKVREDAREKLEEILRIAMILVETRQAKILTKEDVYRALEILGERVARSDSLGTLTVGRVS